MLPRGEIVYLEACDRAGVSTRRRVQQFGEEQNWVEIPSSYGQPRQMKQGQRGPEKGRPSMEHASLLVPYKTRRTRPSGTYPLFPVKLTRTAASGLAP